MARVLVLPALRRPVNGTLVAWGALTFLGALLLPWAREGRELFVYLPETTGAALLARTPLLAVSMGLALAAAVIGLLPWPDAVRGRAAVAVGAAGAMLSTGYLLTAARPFSAGALVSILGFLAVLGVGMALSGLLRTDAFIAASILWVALFVLVFILFPLWSVLKAAVYVKGHLTLAVVAQTVRSPNFLLIDNPATPRNELAVALAAGLAAAVLAAAVLGRVGRWWRRLLLAGGSGLGVFALAALYLGFGAVRNSILLAVVVGVIATALGFLLALLGERSQLWTRRLLGPFSILPIITPPFVLGLAMIYLFGRRGFITYQVLGISTNIFFGPLGVAVAQILAFTPIAYLVLQGVVQAMDVALEEAAETLGASRWHVLRTVIWPLARPGVANAFLLVAIESLADFGNPIIIGGGVPYLATEVFFAIIGRYNPNEAAVYGVVLLMMTLTIFLLQRYWIGRRSYVTITGRPSASRPRPLPRPLDYAVTGAFVLWVALIVALYGSVFVGSMTKLWGFDYTFTLEHFKILLPGGTGWRVFWTSTWLSAVAALPATVLGFLIGYLVTRMDFPGRGALEFGSMLSFAVPGTVMGIGYILAFNQGALLLTGTGMIIVLAFIFRNMPVAIRSGVAAIHQIDRSLEEASTMLRATSPTTLRRIVVPLTWSALLSGLVFAFVRGMTAISQIIFLITPRYSLATAQILSYVEYGSQGRGAVLASVLTLFMIVVIMALYAITRRLGARMAREVAAT